MEVVLKTSNIEVEHYLDKVGIYNINKRELHSLAHLVYVDGKIKLYYFKEVMQLIENLNKQEFIKLYVEKFDGYLEVNESPTNIGFTRSEYIHNYLDTYSFKGLNRGLFIDEYELFVRDLFTAINMGAYKGSYTNCLNSLEVCIFDFLEDEKANGSTIFYKKDLVSYIDSEYRNHKNPQYDTIAPMLLDDQFHKRRYLSILEDAGLIEVIGEYDKELPEFKAMIKDRNTGEVFEDTNSVFLDLNTLTEDNKEFFNDKFSVRRKTSTPQKYLVKSKSR